MSDVFMRLVVVASLVLVGLCGSVVGAEARGGGEPFRTELSGFVDGFEGLPGFAALDLDAARSGIGELSGEQLGRIEEGLSAVPNWQSLPTVLAQLHERRAAHARDRAARAVLAAGASEVGGPAARELESFRREMLYLLAQLKTFAPMMPEGYAERMARHERLVAGLPEEGLRKLREGYLLRAPGWQAALSSVGSSAPGEGAELSPKAFFEACDKDCGALDLPCKIDELLCDIDKAFNEINRLLNLIANFVSDFFAKIADVFAKIAELPGIIADFFSGLFNLIKDELVSFLEGLLEVIPTTREDALALLPLALEGLDWVDTVLASIPVLEPPCPSIGTTLPGLGEVGSTDADYVCKRGIDWLAALIYDVTPDDVFGAPAKLIAAAFYYPINYLCLCMEAQSAIAFADDHDAHHEWVQARLDTRLSTRATEASLNALRSSLTDLSGDVAAVEAKLDFLEVKVDDLTEGMGEQQEFLEAFRDLVLRLNIEENLLDNPSDVVLAFQLPMAFGGYLELVGMIVDDTIAMNEDAGEKTYNALRELNRAINTMDAGDYARAYELFRRAYSEAVRP